MRRAIGTSSASTHPRRTSRLVVASDVRLVHRDGVWWSTHPSLSVDFLGRYLDLGVPVTLVARRAPETSHPVHALSHRGLEIREAGADAKSANLATRAVALARIITALPVQRGDLVVIRVPEVVSLFLGVLAVARRATLVSNVVADSRAISANVPTVAGISNLLYRALTRWLVRRSAGSIYVTQRVLQAEYPPRANTPTLSMSNVRLRPSDFGSTPRTFGPWGAGSPMTVVAVGSMETPTKGYDLLIRAIARLAAEGAAVRLELVGDGALRGSLETLSAELGLDRFVAFHGHVVDRDALFGLLDRSDVFAMPSRNEGLPRAMIEAMARGVCVIGSRVGGIVELAADEALFPPEDVPAMAEVLRRLYEHPSRVEALAAQGRQLARGVAQSADPSRVTRFLTPLLPSPPEAVA